MLPSCIDSRFKVRYAEIIPVANDNRVNDIQSCKVEQKCQTTCLLMLFLMTANTSSSFNSLYYSF